MKYNSSPNRPQVGSWRLWLLLPLLLLSLSGRASHFRYGDMSWRVVTSNTTGRLIEFKVSAGWALNNTNAIPIAFGDGTSANVPITYANIGGVYSYGTGTVQHLYANNGTYIASYGNCCKISTLQNNKDGNWFVRTNVTVGSGNSSPVSTVPAMVNMQLGLTGAKYIVPAADPDGQSLTFALASNAANAWPGTHPAGLSINSSTGEITFNTVGKVAGQLWNTAVSISDGQTTVIVDFIIQITQQSNPPVFDYAVTPANQRVYNVSPGTPVNFTLRATDSDPGSTVKLSGVGIPSGAVVSPTFGVTGNPIIHTFSWTPTASQFGTFIINFTAQDNAGVQTATSVTVQVSLKPRFDVPPTPAAGHENTATPGQAISFTVQASDADPADRVRITAAQSSMNGTPGPLYAGASFSPLPSVAANPTSGTFTWTPTPAQWGERQLVFTATDLNNDKQTHEVDYIINTVPVFSSTPVTTADVGQPYTYNISATDPDMAYGDAVDFVTAQALPTWLTLSRNPATGTAVLSGTPPASAAGSLTITLMAEDIHHHAYHHGGGVPEQTFTITINNCTVLALAQAMTVQLDAAGNASVNAAQVNDGSTASCGIASMTVSPSAFTCANVGDNNVTLTVTDANGNVDTATAVVTVADGIVPSAVAQNLTVALDANGQASITAAQIDNGSADNCAVASVTVSPATFTCANVGANPVTLTVTDASGNVSTAAATVTVEERTVPTAVAQDVTVYLDANGQATLTAAQVNNGSSDNCAVASVAIQQQGLVSLFSLAQEHSTLSITAPAGALFTAVNFASYGTPNDVNGTFVLGSCHAANSQSIVESYLLNQNSASILAGNEVFGDPCYGTFKRLAVQATYTVGSPSAQLNYTCANIGTANPVLLTVTDVNGNMSTASANVTVVDAIAPTAVAQNVTVQLDSNGQASITAAQVNNNSNDNCTVASVSVAPTTFSCANVGDNPVTLTVTDAAGNVSTATATVTVQSALDLLETHVDASCFGASNGSIDLQVVGANNATYAWTGPNGFSATTQDLTNRPAGTYTVVVNANGCSATRSITLAQPADQAPVANADQLSTTACAPIVITPAMLLVNDTDPQGAALQIAEVLMPTSGTITANANGTYTYTPTPGFTGTATFNYVAKKNNQYVAYSGNGHFYEYVPASGICWSDARNGAAARTYQGMQGYLATITSAGENAFAASKLAGNGWLGAADDVVEGEWRWKTGPEAGQLFWRGLSNGSNVTYNSWAGGEPNNAGNEDYAHFYSGSGQWNDLINCPGSGWISGYVVEYGGLETCTPTLTSSATVTVTVNGPVPTPNAVTRNVTVNLNTVGNATITAATVNNGSNSPCGIAALSVSPSTFNCSNVGPNTVTLTVTGAAGGTSTATAIVTVVDATNPIVRAKTATIFLDANGTATLSAAAVDNGSTDNCGIATRTVSKTTFTCANRGANAVILTVTDVNGRSASANTTVTVVDNLAPTVSCQPYTVLLNAQGQASITTANVVAASADNCAVTSLTVSPSTFVAAQAGPNTVTVTARDAAGNISTCQTIVTVVEPAPVAICKPATVQLHANGTATISAADVDNGSYSLVGLSGLTVSPSSFDCSNVGPNTVTLTATNMFGRTASCQAMVTVQDNAAPVALARNVTIQLDAAGNATVTAAQVNNGSSDACGIASMALSATAFTCANVGANAVTLTVTDKNGNVSTAAATVTVEDNIAPTALAQNVTVQLDANGAASVTAAQVNNGSRDNCAVASVSVSHETFTCANVGGNAVILTVTDVNGNTSTAAAIVTVQDNIAPAAVAQNVTVQLDANGAASVSAAQVNNGSSDNCAIASVTVAPSAFTCANVGANAVTLTVTDVNGNVSTAAATVTVQDNIAPTAIAQNLTVQLDANGAASITAAQANNGSFDNCAIASVTVAPSAFGCADLGSNAVTLTVTDVNGNSSTAAATVTVEDLIAPTFSQCPANISVTAQPGDCTPMVSWSAPVAADNCSFTVVASRQPGSRFAVGTTPVTYTVTDRAGNSATCTFSVTVTPTPVVVALSSPTYAGGFNIGCAGANSGAASAAVSGGCQPYSYLWSNGQTTSTATGLAAGTYSVTVTDANNTSVSKTIVLTQPTALALSTTYSPTATFAGANTSTIYLGYGTQSLTLSAAATGGVAAYSYSWSPAAGLSSTTGASVVAKPTTTTTYTVTVTDQNGCSTSRTIKVRVIDARCGTAGNPNKVIVCHNGHEICVDDSAVPAHLAHGCYVGPCGSNASARSTTAPAVAAAEAKLTAYPNPNNGQFEVLVQAATDGAMQVELFDLAGRHVAKLFDAAMSAGEQQQISVNRLGLAEGIYLVRMRNGDQVTNLRVAVLK